MGREGALSAPGGGAMVVRLPAATALAAKSEAGRLEEAVSKMLARSARRPRQP